MAKGMIRSMMMFAAALFASGAKGDSAKGHDVKQKAQLLSNPGFNGFYAPYPARPKNQRQKRKAWRQSNALRRKQSKRAA